MESLTQGKGEGVGFEDGGKAFTALGAKRARIVA
jgi:hypothetical protein